MKKPFLTFLTLICLFAAGLQAAEKTNPKEKFYGKITAINHAGKSFTVHNAKKNTEAEFQWDTNTGVTSNKQAIAPVDLKIGQSLYVAYVTENNAKKATKISVRTPFKKTEAK